MIRQCCANKKQMAAMAVALIITCAWIVPATAVATCGRAPDRTARGTPVVPALQPSEAAQANSTGSAGPTIVGLWHVRFFSNGQLFDEGFDQWQSDGTEILNDNSVPPSLGNVCLGVFKKTASNTFKLVHPAWNWDANGNLIGTIIFREAIVLGLDGKSYHGSFTFTVFNTSGQITDQVTGSIQARRISA